MLTVINFIFAFSDFVKEKFDRSYFLIERIQWLIDELSEGKLTRFAEKAGIPVSTFHGYLKGRAPHPDHLIRILKTYNVNINWLLTGNGPIYIYGEEKKELDHDPEIARLMEGARRVLKSGNPVAFDALECNIKYFDYAIQQEQEMIEQKGRLAEMEKRLAALEKKKKDQPPSGEVPSSRKKVA